MTEKGAGKADKVCARIFAKKGIYKSVGVFLCKRQVYKWVKIQDQRKRCSAKLIENGIMHNENA